MSMEQLPFQIALYGIFIVSGTFHELAHGWSALRLGDTTARDMGRLSFNPLSHIDPIGTILFPLVNIFYGTPFLIGWMKPVPVAPWNLRNPKKDMLIVSLAGPFTNILLGTAAVLTLYLLPTSLVNSPSNSLFKIVEFLHFWAYINYFLAIFNLLPIPPLDGSAIVDFIRKDRSESYHSQGFVGIIILYVLLFSGGFRYIARGVMGVEFFLLLHPLIAGLLFAFLGSFLVLFAVKTKSPSRSRRKIPGKPDPSIPFAIAREIAGKLRRGQELSPQEKKLMENLAGAEGDGKPLCSSLSFHERNEICPPCPNFKRCLFRYIEEMKEQKT